MEAPIIPDEAERLRVLRSYGVLDTEPDPALDRITDLARLTFDVPIALVSLVDDHRQWFKSRQGLDTCETGREHAFCAHALPTPRGSILTVEDATRDPRFADNPLVRGPPHIRFYAGAVLTTPEGANLGTFCLIDVRPRPPLTPLQADTLRALADMTISQLEIARGRRREAEKRQLLELTETMAGVGHWRLEIATGAVDWSDEVYRIHGVSRESFDPALEGALRFYDEEGRDDITRRIEAAVRDRTGYASKLRLRRADGETRIVIAKATCELDARGEVIALVGVFQDVTAQDALLRQVSEDRERYRLLTQNATDVIATYRPDGTFTYLSPAIAKLTGRTAEELVGQTTYAVIHPDDHARVTAEFLALVGRGESSTRIEYRALRKDGGAVWVEAHPSPLFDGAGRLKGFQDVVRDISARRAAQEAAASEAARAEAALAAARESEARYRLLAENANDMISTTSLNSTVLFVTPAIRRLLGYEPEEMIGRRTLDLTHPEDRAAVVDRFTRLVLAGPQAPVEPYAFRGRHKDGRWVWLEGQPRLQVDAAGRPQVFQDVVRDIGERRRVEAELDEARIAAEAAAQAKADFLANMSHELRTPLTSILGFTALAAEQPELSRLTRDYVGRVQNASRALLSTVNDILDFSKLEAGQVVIRPAPTDVGAVCRETIELFTPQAAAKDLHLAYRKGSGRLSALMIDGDRLRQLLLNLIGNAVKFTEAGEVSIAARFSRGELRLEVRDTGCGIAPEALERLFKRFSQVDGSSTRSHGGTGLGLAICKGLAEHMGGSIAVRSEPGVGSCFTLKLPASIASRPAASTPGPGAAIASLEAVRVLVVDDHPANRELARLILAGAGAEIAEASGGVEALAMLETAPFDAVLLDARMPDMDGAAVLDRLRSGRGLNDATPVIAYTADEQLPIRSGRWTFDGCVVKPVRPEALLTAVRRAVDVDDLSEETAVAR